MTPLVLQRLLTVPPLLLIGSLASADAITGRVVDANGVGVAGVDIDVINLGSGGNPHEQNDGTDALGYFTTTIDAAGVYEVRFYPPPPPATTLLTGVVTNVVVNGTKNMGTITLAAGVLLKGKALNSANQPVGNVKCEVVNATTGATLLNKNNLSNAFGVFQVAVPTAPLEVRLLTSSVVGQTLVPRSLDVTPAGTTDLGNLSLLSGFHVTGTVRTQSGSAVVNADVDVEDALTGASIFTPSDNTNSLGAFDVVLAAGIYDLEVTRPPALVLVGAKVTDLAVSTPTNVGVLTLRDGVFLSGTVRDHKGIAVQGADVNVYEVATGQSLALGNDNTNATGAYSVVVPATLLDVVFSPPGPHNLLEKDRHDGLNVSANTTLDGSLPTRPTHTSATGKTPQPPRSVSLFGQGIPGAGGSVPHLGGSRGASGQGLTLDLSGGNPHGTARLVLGRSERPAGALRGVHLVRPLTIITVRLDARGDGHVMLPEHALVHGPLLAQLLVVDPLAQLGYALSPVLRMKPVD